MSQDKPDGQVEAGIDQIPDVVWDVAMPSSAEAWHPVYLGITDETPNRNLDQDLASP